MSHNIQVAITKHNRDLENDLSEHNFLFGTFNGWLVIAAKSGIRKTIAKHNSSLLFAYTDYFGGFGEQSARLVNLRTKKENHYKSINQGLKELGVQAPDDYESDLYDYICLGKIRSNSDLKYYQPPAKLVAELKSKERQLVLLENVLYKVREEAAANVSFSREDLFKKLGNIFDITDKGYEILKK